MKRNRIVLALLAPACVAAATWAVTFAGRSSPAPAPPAAPAPIATEVVPSPPAPPAPPAPPVAPAPMQVAAAPAPPAHGHGGSWVGSGDDGNREVRVIRIGGGTWLGVRIDDVGSDDVSELKLDRAFGARVTEVIDDSPAQKAGLQKDDVIVGFGDQPVPGTVALRRMVHETPAGRSVDLKVIRDGRERTLTVTIEDRKDEGNSYAFGGSESPDLDIEIPNIEIPPMDFHGWSGHGKDWSRLALLGKPRLGVSVQPLSDQLADYFGVSSGHGVLVSDVMAGTPAEKAGLKAGDVITEVAGTKVEDLGDLTRELRRHDGETVTLTIVRNKSERSIDVTLEKRDREEGSSSRDTDKIQINNTIRSAMDAKRQAMRAERMARDESLRQGVREAVEAQKAAASAEAMREFGEQVREQMESRKEQLQRLRERMQELKRQLKEMSAGSGEVQI